MPTTPRPEDSSTNAYALEQTVPPPSPRPRSKYLSRIVAERLLLSKAQRSVKQGLTSAVDLVSAPKPEPSESSFEHNGDGSEYSDVSATDGAYSVIKSLDFIPSGQLAYMARW